MKFDIDLEEDHKDPLLVDPAKIIRPTVSVHVDPKPEVPETHLQKCGSTGLVVGNYPIDKRPKWCPAAAGMTCGRCEFMEEA